MIETLIESLSGYQAVLFFIAILVFWHMVSELIELIGISISLHKAKKLQEYETRGTRFIMFFLRMVTVATFVGGILFFLGCWLGLF